MLSPAANILLRTPRDVYWFIDQMKFVSPGNLHALWIPYPTDTTTNALKPDGRVWTNSATIAGRITRQDNGVLVSFNGTDQLVTTPDTADLSPVDGAFSIVAVVNVTNTAATRRILSKYTAGSVVREFNFYVVNNDRLALGLFDSSASVEVSRSSTSAVTQGALNVLGCSYDPAIGSGATVADGVTLYEHGVVKASASANNASFVAMENTAAAVVIGSDADGANWFTGSMGVVAMWVGTALTAAQHKQIARIASDFYNVRL